MRRSLILTVAAVVSMVLLAMLVPMAVLVRSYALEDRLSRAALEVQATESVVSGQDTGAVAVYLDRINTSTGTRTSVLYPGGPAVGPDDEEDARVQEARETGRARVDDVDDGTQILVPVSRGGSSSLPSQTPVIRVVVLQPGIPGEVLRAWLILALLGLVLLGGALLLADRLGRTFVVPLRALARHTQQLGSSPRHTEPITPTGPVEVQELGSAVNRLVGRIELLLARERESVSDLSHRLRTPVTALRLRIETLADADERRRLGADLDELQAMVDQVVREARRSEREGVDPRTDAVTTLAERIRFWVPLAEDQGRSMEVVVAPAEAPVRASAEDLAALVDVLLDNVFSHTPEGAAVRVSVGPGAGGGAVVEVEDAGPGLPEGLEVVRRGTSGAGSSGLGLAIAERTAAESGGRLVLGRSPLGGASVRVELAGS
ncbi:Signal transduction histidine kinase [Nocardioides scoriae]|uniref:Signal transduction histidine-protein kinase/phosphatase MprB n=1 Tax=Nocardioides scoriae TaxID=642780 RepID=A0A1H1MBT0_9ACTN|nr:HAMP domain-containing sensor histidine kinase [Nocardioides scoriae]SDR84196.1 Signal transduction histidine kinase [Nocardioides scoriae]